MLKTLLAGLALAAATFMAGSASAQDAGKAWDPKITDTDYVMGKADAPVTMLEFASFTCPHCAAFTVNVLPQIEKDYVDTGKVKIVFRQFPLNGLDLRAGMMARCAPREQYFNISKVLFQTQQSWATASDPIAALAQIGGMAGLPKDKFDACLADNSVADAIIKLGQDAQAAYQVNATPTFVVEGEKLEGEASFDTFKAIFDRKLAEKGAATN
ncbi:DsbA family protein [Inquilinus limosus]|uniref:DsbA family protein n=1 Tax=Inquilinus limosus TaxID=171674 RepID=UPI000551F220|nr:DsbA family protein [Inquilinus limosus]